MKGRKVVALLIVMFLAVALFAGCAPKTQPSQETKNVLKVAAVYATPIEEPWDGAIHQALLKAKTDLGIQYDWTENVGYSDFERVLRDYAQKGYNIIFGDGFGSEDAVRRVAKDYPKIAFVFGMGGGASEPNLSVFDDWIHEPAYLCGIIAGKITKSNNIGVVCAIPDPEVNRIVNAYIEGAKSVNPKVYVQVSFIGSWFDPTKAKEMALAQISKGADVMFAERYGVIDACKEKGVLAFGNILDQNSLAPDYVITGPVWNMYPTVEYVVKSVQNGSYQAQDLREWSMMAKGGAELAPFHGFENKLPKDVMDLVNKTEQQIKNGEFRVPINEAPPVSG
jgi:basic membrane lipoprotein Med (substrate-binding protein (PBP1-ABC) superfamily)